MAGFWPVFLLSCLAPGARAWDATMFGDASGLMERARVEAAAMPGVAGRPVPAPPRGTVDNPWSRVAKPSPLPPESIGSTSAGCLRGAVPLELHGPGFEVMRPSRRRMFGHPRLLAFLRNLGAAASSAGLGSVIIGDLGQPRGGPTLSGHASHQNGLDADLWYQQVPAGTRLSDRDRETMSAESMVVPDFERPSARWNPAAVERLRLAASDPSIERIFVNPVVKQGVCERYRGKGWVGKLRPWWGHDDHFHIRLSCTPGDKHCSVQEPVPAGDGCGEDLANWFTPEMKDEAYRKRTEPGPPPTMPTLPALCRQVLAE